MKESRIFDIEEHLIDFALRIIRVGESLPKTKIGNHLAEQPISLWQERMHIHVSSADGEAKFWL